MRHAPRVVVTEEDRRILEGWVRSSKTEQRLVFRAKVILFAHEGHEHQEIAAKLDSRPATIARWRSRYLKHGLAGLVDASRSGRPKRYGRTHEQRVLSLLDQQPPQGYAHWNGQLVAEALNDISARQVWRILDKHAISLQRRRSWCVSTDPEFTQKAADVVGLYLSPPDNAVVLSIDEKPAIQALERAQGYLKLPNGKAFTGFTHEYTRHGTTTLFAALDIVTGQVKAGHYRRRRRKEFLSFMNEIVALYPDQELHVIVDNLNTHKPKHDRWQARHPKVHFHYTPTHASWLNQIEVWFSILSRQALTGASFTSPQQVRKAIDHFVEAYNKKAAPFEWKKQVVYQKQFKYKYADLCQ